MTSGYFVTATGTDVGKTYISALLVKEYKDNGKHVGYYKAALSGAIERNGVLDPIDATFVKEFSNIATKDTKVSYIFKTAVSPHLAASIENKSISLEVIKNNFMVITQQHDFMIVEGSGGIICPLSKDILLEDVMKITNFPLLIVTRSGLGSINEAVLTVNYAKSKSLLIAGFIMNYFEEDNFLHQDNKIMIETLTNIKVIGYVKNKDTKITYIK